MNHENNSSDRHRLPRRLRRAVVSAVHRGADWAHFAGGGAVSYRRISAKVQAIEEDRFALLRAVQAVVSNDDTDRITFMQDYKPGFDLQFDPHPSKTEVLATVLSYINSRSRSLESDV